MHSNWSIKWGTELSYNTTNKSRSNKASEEAVRVAGARFSGRVTERGDSTSGRCTALPFPSGLPGVVPLVRGLEPLSQPTPHTMAPRTPATGSSRRQRAPRAGRVPGSAHKGDAWAPPRPALSQPRAATRCRRERPGTRASLRIAGEAGRGASHRLGLPPPGPVRRGGVGPGTLTFSMVPGSRRSSSLQRTTPSFRDACRKPSGSEMVFLGDSSTPKVMSHVTVCSAEFIAAARPASPRREPVSAPFTSERPRPGG